jgi:hypothetical protein
MVYSWKLSALLSVALITDELERSLARHVVAQHRPHDRVHPAAAADVVELLELSEPDASYGLSHDWFHGLADQLVATPRRRELGVASRVCLKEGRSAYPS